jgi:hypothetical protein
LLGKSRGSFLRWISRIIAVEKCFELGIAGLDMTIVGAIDLIADIDGISTVLDFKTSPCGYEKHAVALSDQLTMNRIAEPAIEQTGFCVLIKTKDSQIQWHASTRNKEKLSEILEKAEYVAQEIRADRYYRRPEKWCSWCDYLPVCIENGRKTEEALMQGG